MDDDWVHIANAAATMVKNLSEVLAQRAPKEAAVQRQQIDTRERVTKQPLQMQTHMQ